MPGAPCNAAVVKPSEYTPLSVLGLIHVLNQVLPADVLHVVPGGGEVGKALSEHDGVEKIMFTGSTKTGQAIMRSAADGLARLTLELGGNDAGVVLPDVDLQAIAGDLFWGAFINTGQTCAALTRLYVHEDVYDSVCEALVGVAQQMPMGNGREEQNVLGPLQNKLQYGNPLVGQEQKGCGNSSGDPSESLPREWCAGEGCCGY